MEDVRDEPLYRSRVCGIDIGKAELYATIRVPSDGNPARRASETRRFATTKRGVLELADWLRCWQVPAMVMEATGDYWKGPFYRLEAEGFECVLADARQVKNLPGRPKRDPSDSAWLAACFERGAVTACFVAAPEFRLIRLHTRYRLAEVPFSGQPLPGLDTSLRAAAALTPPMPPSEPSAKKARRAT
jgi:transposase